MTMRILTTLSMLAMLASTPALRADPLVDPAPIPVPAGVDQPEVARAIGQALMYRNWMVTAQQPGRVDARLYLRGNRADIRIDYDASAVRIAYVDSRGLDERSKDGVRQITGRYLVWMHYLSGDIATGLQHSPRR